MTRAFTDQESKALAHAIENDDGQKIRQLFTGRAALVNQQFSNVFLLQSAIFARSPNAVETLLDLGATLPIRELRNCLNVVQGAVSGTKPVDKANMAMQECRIFRLIAEKIAHIEAMRYDDEYGWTVFNTVQKYIQGNQQCFKAFLSTFVQIGIPQYDVKNPANLLWTLGLMQQHPAHIGALASEGIDFSPLAHLSPAALKALQQQESAEFDTQWEPIEWAGLREQHLLPSIQRARKHLDLLFKDKHPTLHNLLDVEGIPLPDTRSMLCLGLTPELFSPRRWKHHIGSALVLADALGKALPSWQREQLERQIDFLALRREADANGVSVASMAAHALAYTR